MVSIPFFGLSYSTWALVYIYVEVFSEILGGCDVLSSKGFSYKNGSGYHSTSYRSVEDKSRDF